MKSLITIVSIVFAGLVAQANTPAEIANFIWSYNTGDSFEVASKKLKNPEMAFLYENPKAPSLTKQAKVILATKGDYAIILAARQADSYQTCRPDLRNGGGMICTDRKNAASVTVGFGIYMPSYMNRNMMMAALDDLDKKVEQEASYDGIKLKNQEFVTFAAIDKQDFAFTEFTLETTSLPALEKALEKISKYLNIF